MNRRRVSLAAAVLAALVALSLEVAVRAWTAALDITLEGDHGSPWTLAELVSDADTIVLGRVTGHAQERGEVPPLEFDGPAGMPQPPTSRWATVEETLEVVELVKESGPVGQTYVVQLPGDVPGNLVEWRARERSVWPVGRVGDEYLDFLEGIGDEYALAYGPYGRIRLTGDVVEFSNGTPVPFAAGMTPDQFYQAVKEEVAHQSRFPSPSFPAEPGVSRPATTTPEAVHEDVDVPGPKGPGVVMDPSSRGPSRLASGRYVVFGSMAEDLGSDHRLDATVRSGGDGSDSDGHSRLPVISGDGRWVVFESWAGNLSQGGHEGMDVFVADAMGEAPPILLTELVGSGPMLSAGAAPGND